jgi:hypothetical protein
MVTVLPLTVHADVVVLANVTALVDAPPVAETLNVPPGLKVGLAGVAMKLVIACEANPIVTSSVTCGAAV